MSKINPTYKSAMAMIVNRMIKNWSGDQRSLEKELETFIEIVYEDGQNSVKRDV